MSISKVNTSYLIVLNWDGEQRLSNIKDSFQPYFQEKEHFEILLYSSIKKLKADFELPSRMYVITTSEFNLFGKLKSKKSLPTEYTHFDVALILDPLTVRHDKVIKQMNIKHIVAFDYEREYVEINLIQSGKLPVEKVNFAKQILTKISD